MFTLEICGPGLIFIFTYLLFGVELEPSQISFPKSWLASSDLPNDPLKYPVTPLFAYFRRKMRNFCRLWCENR